MEITIPTWLSWFLRIATATSAAFWGGLSTLVQALIILMLMDIASGLLAGFVTQKLNSDISLKGCAKKAMVLLLIGMAALLQTQTTINFLDDAVAGFFIMHEGLSILENAVLVGLPIPTVLRDALTKISDAETSQTPQR